MALQEVWFNRDVKDMAGAAQHGGATPSSLRMSRQAPVSSSSGILQSVVLSSNQSPHPLETFLKLVSRSAL